MRETVAQRREGEGLVAATVEALSGTLGLRDGETAEHSERVIRLAERLARRLSMQAEAVRDLRYAAALHDIGKVGIPDAVLGKPGPLDAAEWDLMQCHAAWGAALLARIPGLERVASAVRHHHERFDGHGYPDGLVGDAIPVEARVLAVADAYVAMGEDRPYRRALGEEEATRELRAGRDAQFDPEVLDALEAELE